VNEFLEVQADHKGPGIIGWWGDVLPELTDKQRDDLLLAAKSRGISHRTISIVLGQWGFQVTPTQVGHWRRNHVR
jgi:hypothetical protein